MPVVAHLPFHLTLPRCRYRTPGPTPSAASGSSHPHRPWCRSRASTPRMPHLLLHEQRIDAVLDQVRHIGMPQAMDRQLDRQPGRRPVEREPVIDRTGRDPTSSLGRPERRRLRSLEPRSYLHQVLLQRLDRPRHHTGNRPPARRRTAHRFAEPDVAHPEPTELGGCRVGGEVGQVQHRHLPATQSPAIGHLQQRGVAERGQPTLATGLSQPLRPIISGVEQPLALHPRQRPAFWATLIVRDVDRGVVLMADLTRAGPDPLLALSYPAIARIDRVRAERPDRSLIVPHRRMRPAAVRDPTLELLSTPTPRPALRELLETPHRLFAPVNQ